MEKIERRKLSTEELQKLKQFKSDVGLSQGKLLRIHNINISNYERGVNAIPTEVLKKLAVIYGKEEVADYGTIYS